MCSGPTAKNEDEATNIDQLAAKSMDKKGEATASPFLLLPAVLTAVAAS